MMNTIFDVIRFTFTAPLHISNARSDYARSEDVVRSDTLCAAIMQSWAVLGHEDWITDQPGFVTSSLFPYTRLKDEWIYFLPKPVKDQLKNKPGPELLKRFKRVRYYEKEFFEQRLDSPLVVRDGDIADEYLSGRLKRGNSSLYRSMVMPRIMKPRDPQDDTRIFYMERREFVPGAGLFCLVKYQSDEAKTRFLAGLRLLGENGLGSDRTVGYGRFTFTEDEITFSHPVSSDYMISLSLYLPDYEQEFLEALGPAAKYELVRRGGWISEPFNTLRKRNVYMFTEGSLLKFNGSGEAIKGRIVDVKPLALTTHHAIYRSGKSIFLPIKNNQDE